MLVNLEEISSYDQKCYYSNSSKFILFCFHSRIGIADKNDNPPYFDKHLYEAEVDENEDIQHTVLTVTANDKDECKYKIQFITFSHC